MWTYGDPVLIRPRQSLGVAEGFWVDHWLFLHMDVAFGVWRARPLGLKGLANMVASGESAPRAIIPELEGYARLCRLLGEHAPSADAARSRGGIEFSWREWAEQYTDGDVHHRFTEAIAAALERAISNRDFETIAYLSRRLASELGDHTRSQKDIFTATCRALEEERLSCIALAAQFTSPADERTYTVSYSVTPVEISSRISTLRSRGVALIKERNEESPSQPTYRLTGITVSVSASTASAAYEESLPLCRTALDDLRTRHYLRTSLFGPVTVEGDEGGEVRMFSLHQPFWTKKGARDRALPTLPKNFNLLLDSPCGDEGARWAAVKWHISQALRSWPEDVHSAASGTWQALESLISKSRKRGAVQGVLENVVQPYLRTLRSELAAFICNQINAQARAYRAYGGSDWPTRKVSEDPHQWLVRVLDRSSPVWYRRWRVPPAPYILFAKGPGLVRELLRDDGSWREADWMFRRLESDFAHLYAMRNAIVHRGVRFGSDRWAGYLAALGLEALYSLASERVSALQAAMAATKGAG